MLQLIQAPLSPADESLPQIWVRADRITLAKRRWRGAADDGKEFGCELEAPLQHGDTLFQTATARYVVRQEPEAVVEVSLDLAPSAAAGIGWAIGNLHLDLSAEATRLLAPDEPAVRQLLDRLGIPFRAATAIFRPGRFVRHRQAADELGPSHQH